MILGGLALAVAGALPLLLVIGFGPRDANPIGLGLLMVLAVPAGVITMAAGLIYGLISWLVARNA